MCGNRGEKNPQKNKLFCKICILHIKTKKEKILQKSEVKNMNEYTVEKKYIEHMQKIGWKFIELKNYD